MPYSMTATNLKTSKNFLVTLDGGSGGFIYIKQINSIIKDQIGLLSVKGGAGLVDGKGGSGGRIVIKNVNFPSDD